MRTWLAAALLLSHLIVASAAEPPGSTPEVRVQQVPGVPRPQDRALAASWEVPVPETPAPMVVGTGDGFVVASRSGKISSFPLDGGPALWQAQLGAPLASLPVLSGSRLVIPLEDGSIALLDASTGSVSARLDGIGSGLMLSTVPGGVAISDPAGSVALLDPESAVISWKVALPAPPSAPVAACAGTLLVGTSKGSLVSISFSGQLLWEHPLGGPVATAAACAGDRAYVGGSDNKLHALKVRPKRCRLLWSFITGGDIVGPPLVRAERVMFFSLDTYLYALRADNGHLAWKIRMGRRPRPSAALVGDLLFVAPLNAERLDAFRLPGGASVSHLALEAGLDRFVTPPALAGKLVVIGAARYGEESARVIGLDPLGSGSPVDPALVGGP